MTDFELAQQALAEIADPELLASEYELARALILCAKATNTTLATGESLTGGMLAELITSVAGASQSFQGGIVAYNNQAKIELLNVDAELIRKRSAIDADVALQMAAGAAHAFAADLGLACTGVAGPDPSDGHPVGEVHIAAHDARNRSSRSKSLSLGGSRDDIRVQTCVGLLGLALDLLLPGSGLQPTPKPPTN